MGTIAVLTTTDREEDGKAIARALVERKLAACVQISAIESIYTWEGEAEESAEFRLLIKTTSERYPEVEAAIRELHTYDLPAIVGFRMEFAFEQFADWVAENSQPDH